MQFKLALSDSRHPIRYGPNLERSRDTNCAISPTNLRVLPRATRNDSPCDEFQMMTVARQPRATSCRENNAPPAKPTPGDVNCNRRSRWPPYIIRACTAGGLRARGRESSRERRPRVRTHPLNSWGVRRGLTASPGRRWSAAICMRTVAGRRAGVGERAG